ncbi:hypothetical protein CSA57_01510 [candidate division KSB3 bacterium]|nr:MAG: hypothetical protein CSA57_01510 [candidate division KSB3 bacterium]
MPAAVMHTDLVRCLLSHKAPACQQKKPKGEKQGQDERSGLPKSVTLIPAMIGFHKISEKNVCYKS